MEATKQTLLIVDDSPQTLSILVDILNGHYRGIVAKSGEKALELAAKNRPDLVLLDVIMPGMDGYAVCKALKADPATRDIPVIFITVLGEEDDETQGFELGAVDYITKPFSPAIVRARIQTHLELKRHRDELEQLVEARTQAMEQAMRAAETANEAKSRFLAKVSHELRTPMNGIIAMAELIAMSGLDEEQTEYLDIVRSSADTLLLVIEDILGFSQAETGQLLLENERFAPTEFFRHLANQYATKTEEKGLAFTPQIPSDLAPWLEGDVNKLRQILTNLLGNALKFTPQGEVGFSVIQTTRDDGRIELRCEIRDTGIGIPQEKQVQLFRSFAQIDESITRQYGGLGLGLVISKYLVEAMDGTLGMESIEDQGAMFWIAIPFSPVDNALAMADLVKNGGFEH